MPTPRQRANNKYNLKAYKRWDMRIRPELYDELETLRASLGLSKPELIKCLLAEYKKH